MPRVSCRTPPFAAVYGTTVGRARSLISEAMWMILPRLRSIMPGSTACDTMNGAVRLVAMMSSQSFCLNSWNGARRWMPALLTRMSIRPWRAIAAATPASHRVALHDVERGDVGRVARRRVSACDGLAQLVRLAPVEDDRGAGLGHAARDGEAEAAIRAGDERDAPGEIEGRGCGVSAARCLRNGSDPIPVDSRQLRRAPPAAQRLDQAHARREPPAVSASAVRSLLSAFACSTTTAR